MEIKINIQKNDYVQPTEVREEIVQKICDFFLPNSYGCSPVFHPSNDGAYRDATLWISREISKSSGKEVLCGPMSYSRAERYDKNPTKIHGVEVSAAFEALRRAGYYMFRIYEYNSWMGYMCSKKPFVKGGVQVTEFTDFID